MKTNKDKWEIVDKSKIVIRLHITFSKLMSFLILIASSWYGLKTKDSSVIILGMTISAGLIGWRQQKQKQIKENEKTIN